MNLENWNPSVSSSLADPLVHFEGPEMVPLHVVRAVHSWGFRSTEISPFAHFAVTRKYIRRRLRHYHLTSCIVSCSLQISEVRFLTSHGRQHLMLSSSFTPPFRSNKGYPCTIKATLVPNKYLLIEGMARFGARQSYRLQNRHLGGFLTIREGSGGRIRLD